MPGNVTQVRLDELIWAKDQVKALAQSIFQNGGIREAIIVQPVGKNRYRVREGNSRTVCNRHLAEQHPGDDRFAFVPAHVFEHNLTEEDIAVLLADFHVAGKIGWGMPTNKQNTFTISSTSTERPMTGSVIISV